MEDSAITRSSAATRAIISGPRPRGGSGWGLNGGLGPSGGPPLPLGGGGAPPAPGACRLFCPAQVGASLQSPAGPGTTPQPCGGCPLPSVSGRKPSGGGGTGKPNGSPERGASRGFSPDPCSDLVG